MEAGYDYLLLRGRLQRKFFRYTGIIIFVFGALLLATGGAYYGYAAKARADLDNLNVTLPGAVTGQGQVNETPKSDGISGSSVALIEDSATLIAPMSAKILPGLSMLAINNSQLYPGEALSAVAWSNPWSFEPLAYQTQILLQGFTPISPGSVPPAGALNHATRLLMP
ncbi:MAG: hypothetical protein IIC33_09265, partial [Chloroflexi bacterium]|nr:hypothetical protein [Chloroflexota bacterium]